MNHTDVDHVLIFSDRPHRIAQYITAEELAKSWKLGINSFEKDPPNAGFVAGGLKEATVVELLRMEVTESKTVYQLSLLLETDSSFYSRGIVGSFSPMMLFIDSDSYCGTVVFNGKKQTKKCKPGDINITPK